MEGPGMGAARDSSPEYWRALQGLGLAPVEGPCRARCRATAQPGGRSPGQAAQRSWRAPVARSRALADAGHLLQARPDRLVQRQATSSKSSIACESACHCAFGAHSIRTPPLVEIHKDGVGQFREHYRPRSAQCVVRAHAAKLNANSPRLLARANGYQFALTASAVTRTTRPK